ncbi:MAG TPA: DUF2461 domain-containing protein [Flavobacteriales bacterium]|nr:DUF2461 domain-containing protein [Flavobacteriales bacterium]
MSTYFSPDFNKFLKELASNNNKDWFDVNRERYFKSVKEPFEKFVADFIANVQKIDKEIKTGPKESIHRINNDIRFSKDKTIYKTYRSAIIALGGKKGGQAPGFYFELGPEHVALYGGAYIVETAALVNLRNTIAKNLKEFDKLVNDKKFKATFGDLQGQKSVRVPANLKAAAEKQPLLFNKEFYFGTEKKASLVTSKDLMKTMLEHYKIALPMIKFLRKAVG